MNFKTFSLFIITTLVLYGCSGVKLQKYPAEKCAIMPGDKTVNVINDKCSLCHKGDFAGKEMICSKKSLITDAVTSKRMPKIGKLSDDELKTILKWDL